MDYAKLRGLIREKYHTERAFAEAIGLTPAALSLKLNNKDEWSDREIAKACEVLGIDLEMIGLYFFTPKVAI